MGDESCEVCEIAVPREFLLRDAVCSYGFYMCAPNRWIESEHRFVRTLHIPRVGLSSSVGDLAQVLDDAMIASLLSRLHEDEARIVEVDVCQDVGQQKLRIQARTPGSDDEALRLDESQWRVIGSQVRRMLRLSEREQEAVTSFRKAWCANRCMASAAANNKQALPVKTSKLTAELQVEAHDPLALELMAPITCDECGRLGRIFRSPTLFEDAIKTVTGESNKHIYERPHVALTTSNFCLSLHRNKACNIAWPGTLRMNEALCAFGGTFPLPSQLAKMDAPTLQASCGVGYRADRIIRLAKAFASAPPLVMDDTAADLSNDSSRASRSSPPPPPPPPPTPFKTPRSVGGSSSPRKKKATTTASSSSSSDHVVDVTWFESPSRTGDQVYSAALAWHGFGPFAAANVCQLLGHYDRIPADSETVRHLREYHNVVVTAPAKEGRGKGSSPDKAKLGAALDRLYGPFGEHKFLAYWIEMWHAYKRKTGVQHMAELESDRFGVFTAATLAKLGSSNEMPSDTATDPAAGEHSVENKRKRKR